MQREKEKDGAREAKLNARARARERERERNVVLISFQRAPRARQHRADEEDGREKREEEDLISLRSIEKERSRCGVNVICGGV